MFSVFYFNKTPQRKKKISLAFSWPFMVLYKAERYKPGHYKLRRFIPSRIRFVLLPKMTFFFFFVSKFVSADRKTLLFCNYHLSFTSGVSTRSVARQTSMSVRQVCVQRSA